MITLKQLRYLVGVADHLNFRRAATACHVTQPALTAQIQELEDRLGVRLVERNRHKVMLTSAGTEVTSRARRILRDVDDLAAVGRQAGRPLGGPLRLGVIPTIGPYLLPDLLPAVRGHYPDLQLYLREDRTPRLLEALAEGRLELLLLALPVEARDVETMALFEEPFFVAAALGHPLAGRDSIRERDLDGQTVLLLEEEHCLREQALAVCRLAGASEAVGLQATSLNTLVQMVANRLGITLLPQMSLPVEMRNAKDVVVRPFAEPVPSRQVGLAWRRSSPRESDYRQLGELLVSIVLQLQRSASGTPAARAT